ncbi:ATP synthase subunit I [Marinobacterium sediminicola]|uniref:ATP synthase protein I n=1 Tax=Marinobacterium sediminicola TaxID=518898 RepID=A0ABY1S3V2_9GAMM|nr:ATP synthase subunit I [Marinobacterium sediminicola]ULG69223.1 ATP synthase subunit I [Marinobacterium sediminicola]SMR78314.1 ATP synthase protein I [Marinobacterium sediminicola]
MSKGEAEQAPAAVSRHVRRSYREFIRILLVQAVLILLVSTACLLKGTVEAYSALIGGMLYLLPNLYFTWRALGNRHANSARTVLVSMYASEIGKMMLAVALFSAAFLMVRPLSPFSLFGTFILLQLSGWILQMKLFKTSS